MTKIKISNKSATGVTLKLSINSIGNDDTNFPHKLLLRDRQISSICQTILQLM